MSRSLFVPPIAVAAALLAVRSFSGVPAAAISPLSEEDNPAMSIEITSPAFTEGEPIPSKHTCDAEDVSPPLNWSRPPAGTKSLALICDDPDAPVGNWVHWVLYGLPAAATGLPEGVPPDEDLPDGSRQGRNDFRKIGYGGPCPPAGGPHRYFFNLYALDTEISLAAGSGKKELLKAMEGHILAGGHLMGTYQRKR